VTREVTILADDLTGAADCAAALASAGRETYVSLDPSPAASEAAVLSLDLDTRGETPEIAYARTRTAARAALAAGSNVLYKKIDSTLRGHVGPEIAAVLAATIDQGGPSRPRPLVVLCPAYPATGRLVRAGRVRVDGIALDADPTALLAGAGLTASALAAHRDAAALAREMESRAAAGADAVVCDAESDGDLRVVAEAGARLARPVVWSGSGGLARHVRSTISPGAERAVEHLAPPACSGPMLILVGSPSDVAQRQAAALGRDGSLKTIAVGTGALLAGDGSPAWRDTAGRVERALAGGCDVCLVLERGTAPAPHADRALARALGALSAVRAPIGALLATGGDTARAALAARGIRGLRVRAELEPGVVVSATDEPRPLTVATKAGGFGDAGTLARARAALRSVPSRILAG
jgi:uncharacterized protein YgbK (DUF1537 family)